MNQSNHTGSLNIESCGIIHPSIITKTSLVVAYVILCLVACLENSLVIHLVRTCKELKQSTFNYLIINMAIADVLGVVLASLLSLWFTFVGKHWIPGLTGNISCKLAYFLSVMSIGLSISTLVIMSVDRYLAIMYTTRRSMTASTTKRCIALSWIIAAIAASPFLYKMRTTKYNDSYFCKAEWSSIREEHLFYSKIEECVKFALYYVIPLTAIGSTNTIIVHTLRTRQPIGCSQTQIQIDKQNKKILMLLVSVVFLFAFCWMFAHLNHVLSVFQTSTFCKLPAFIPLFFFWISHVNSAINPIIYFIFNEKFRQGIRQAFRVNRVELNNDPARNVYPRENVAFEGIELETYFSRAKEEQLDFNTKL